MEKETKNIITVENLNTYYGNTQILKNITCEIPKNKITAVIGQSGCGKSTFLKSINRIVEEEDGKISGKLLLSDDNNIDITKMPEEALRKRIGIVFQTPIVFPLSVKNNMLYPLNYHYKLDENEKLEKITFYLKMAGLYDEVKGNLNISATKLSGGQKQRLSIARCLCIEPDVLMLDEPCSALDMRNTMLIENLLFELKKFVTIILVTHNLSQAKRLADYVLFMDNGELIEANDKTIFSSPHEKLTKEYIRYSDGGLSD